MAVGFAITEAETADLIDVLEGLTDEAFLADPALADRWPVGPGQRGAE